MRLLLLYIYILFFKANIFAQIKQEINANPLVSVLFLKKKLLLKV